MSVARRGGWAVVRRRGPAAELHAASAGLVAAGAPEPAATPLSRAVHIIEAERPALVLGAGEPAEHVDLARAERAGVAVARRRSGGSAVLVGPGHVVWVDVVVPVGDPLWHADVGVAGWWLGEVWAGALDDVGVTGAQVWRGGFERTAWSPLVCFAGVGPGEVVGPAAAGRPKLVGVSARRTRAGALFQCAVPVVWDAGPTLDVLRLPGPRRRAGRSELAGVAAGVGDRAGALEAAFVARLQGTAPAPGA